VLALVLYLSAALGLTYRLWLDPLHSTLGGGGGDAALFLSFLSNTASSLWSHQGHGLLVTHALNAPNGVNAMWNTSLLLPGVLLSPVTIVAGPVLTLNLILLLGPALSAWSAYLCSGRFLTRFWPRAVAGLLFGFSPALLSAELGHPHLTLLPLVPPLLLVGVDLLVGRGSPARGGLLLGVLVAAQLITGEEVLALTGVSGAVLALVLAAQHRQLLRCRVRPVLQAAAVTVLTAAVLVGYPLLVQLTGPGLVRGGVQPHDVYVLDPVSLATPNSVPIWHLNPFQGLPVLHLNNAEDMGYVGVPLLLLVAAIAWWGRRLLVARTAAVTAAVLLVLAMGETLHLAGGRKGVLLPWALTRGAPLLSSLLPIRWMLIVDLLLAVLVGLWLDEKRRNVFRSAVVVLALLPLLPHALVGVSPTRTPAFFTDHTRLAGGTVLVLPYPTHENATAMLWQAASGMSFAMPGGYFIGPQRHGQAGFGDYPRRPTERYLVTLEAGRQVVVSSGVRQAVREDLAYWGVDEIVLGPTAFRRQLMAFVIALTHQQPQRTGGVLLWSYPIIVAG
jgi:hypothetical protein